jgi:hypothetical protein
MGRTKRREDEGEEGEEEDEDEEERWCVEGRERARGERRASF